MDSIVCKRHDIENEFNKIREDYLDQSDKNDLRLKELYQECSHETHDYHKAAVLGNNGHFECRICGRVTEEKL